MIKWFLNGGLTTALERLRVHARTRVSGETLDVNRQELWVSNHRLGDDAFLHIES